MVPNFVLTKTKFSHYFWHNYRHWTEKVGGKNFIFTHHASMVHGREYRPYSIISFHRDRSRSAERLGCVPLRWKFWSSERKTVDRGDTSPWKRVGCSYPTSKRWEANRLSKRPHSAGVFLSKIFLSNGVERDWHLLFENFSWEKSISIIADMIRKGQWSIIDHQKLNFMIIGTNRMLKILIRIY